MVIAAINKSASPVLRPPRLHERFSHQQTMSGVTTTAPAASPSHQVSQISLALAGSVWTYGSLRFLQVLAIAPVFPIIVARIAQHASGEAIGIVNSARIAAAFVGPVIATSMLSHAPAPAVYLVLAALGLVCVPLVGVRTRRADGGRLAT